MNDGKDTENKITAIHYMHAMGLINESQKKDCIDFLTGEKRVCRKTDDFHIFSDECIKQVTYKYDLGYTMVTEKTYTIIPYKKSLDPIAKATMKRKYIRIGKDETTPVFLPVYADDFRQSLYIPFSLYSNHIIEISYGDVFLSDNYNDEGYAIRISTHVNTG